MVSVASPVAPGTRSVGASAAWKRSPEAARTEHGKPDRDGQHGGRSSAPTRTRRRGVPGGAPPSLRLDARSQGRRRLDLGRGALGERDRALLLGEPVGKLRRRRDARLERGAALGRERPVRERGQLGDLLTAGLVLSTASHRHGNTKGNSEREPAASRGARRKAGSRRCDAPTGRRETAPSPPARRASRCEGEGNPREWPDNRTVWRTHFRGNYSVRDPYSPAENHAAGGAMIRRCGNRRRVPGVLGQERPTIPKGNRA